jgi:hypothetical protein
MQVIRCPKCFGQLQVAPEAAGRTRPCPFCGTAIQLASEHKPIPAHRWRDWQQGEQWFTGGGAANVLGLVMLCAGVLLGGWMVITFLPSASSGGSASARSVPIEVQCDSSGIKGRITNNSSIALSGVSVVVRVLEDGRPTPVISGVYHLEPAGGIASGETADCKVFWRDDDRRSYARAKGPLAFKIELSALIRADGEALYVDPS